MNNLFKTSTLLFLSLHAAGFMLSVFTVLGFPGQIDKETVLITTLSKILNVLLIAAWKGIPWLVAGSAIAFYFKYDIIAKSLCFLSLGIGIGLVITLIILYNVRS